VASAKRRQRLFDGLLLGAITGVFCAAAGIGAPVEVPFEAAFGFVVGFLVPPGQRDRPGVSKRLVAIAVAWLVLLGAYLALLLHSVE
jgi:hypothetical protein